MQLKDALNYAGVSYAKLAKLIGLSAAALCRLTNYGEYPTRRDADEVKTAILAVLDKHGVNPADVKWPAARRPGYGNGHRREAALGQPLVHRESGPAMTQEEIDLMQIHPEVLSYFGIRRNPFLNDVEADEDVYTTKAYKHVEESILKAIEDRAMVAVVGPSGAGKTTIWDGVQAALEGRDDVKICRPYLTERDKLSPGHITRALIYGLAGDNAVIKANAEDQGRQLARHLLASNYGKEFKPVLYIDDAHFASTRVLRQIKTFYESKVGRHRVLAIVLVGLEELKDKLAIFPEIGNRITLVEVQPVSVRDYLEFKLKRVGVAVSNIFDPAGLEALLDRFKPSPRAQPRGYPLEINNTVIVAMVKRFRTCAGPGEKVGRDVVDSLDLRPRRTA